MLVVHSVLAGKPNREFQLYYMHNYDKVVEISVISEALTPYR